MCSWTAAKRALVLPQAREACPHNLAPTTSSLMQLALGDALARRGGVGGLGEQAELFESGVEVGQAKVHPDQQGRGVRM